MIDLLNARKPVSVLEDSFGTTQLVGAQDRMVASKATLLDAINEAASFRKTAATQKNAESSRSHAICRIRIENPSMPSAEDGFAYLVDLAGSEVARDVTAHAADRMRERREINASLSVLKDCVRGRAMLDASFTALTNKTGTREKPPYIPFRQSLLTKVLKPVFDPSGHRSCRTVVIACVNPCLADLAASKNTLRYAEMLRVVVPKTAKAEFNPHIPLTWNNEQAKEWITNNVSDIVTDAV
jgi:kinesin family protein 2/24